MSNKSLYIPAEENVHYTRHPDPNDSWDTGNEATIWSFSDELSYGEDYKGVTPHYNGLLPISLGVEDLEVGKVYRAHVITVNTGHSFGTQENYYCYLIAVTDVDVRDVDKNTFPSSHKPWDGYFESVGFEANFLVTYTGETREDTQ